MLIKKVTIDLGKEIDDELESEIIKESVFVSESLQSLKVKNNKIEIEIEILYKEESEIQLVKKKVEKFIAAIAKGHRPVPENSYVEKENNANFIDDDIFETLLELNWVSEIGGGYLAFSGPALNLFNFIDQKISSVYNHNFPIEERHFPALISSNILAKSGYFDSHPNNVSFATHLKNDFDIIENFRKKYGNETNMNDLPIESVATPHTCLNPAACLPSYFVLENQQLKTNLAWSWLGKVFRHEAKNITGLERLWEYNVREIVFIGDKNFVLEKKQEIIPIICNILDVLGLNYRIVSSTDPFFATVSAVRKFWQKSTQAKLEIKLQVHSELSPKSTEVAAGSINYHDSIFGAKFNIKAIDNEIATSACVGLGIERIMLACFAQHGVKPDKWPVELATKIFTN
jgi:seryl-tRNA synthetase